MLLQRLEIREEEGVDIKFYGSLLETIIWILRSIWSYDYKEEQPRTSADLSMYNIYQRYVK